jgi:hypothetical protein
MQSASLFLPAILAFVGPDPTYKPSIGDRVYLCSATEDQEGLRPWCATTRGAFVAYYRALLQKDSAKQSELQSAEKILDLDATGTEVLVMDFDDNVVIRGQRDVTETEMVVVRVLGGPHRDKKLFTPKYQLTRFKPRRFVPEGLKAEVLRETTLTKPATTPSNPAAVVIDHNRAETLLYAGGELEAAGKTSSALDCYRLVRDRFPGTPQATRAQKRLNDLAGAP